MSNDETWMQAALDAAKKGRPSPNPQVGAIVVKDDKIVGTGFHEAAGEAHAEIRALREAGPLAKDATLFVTLEPCNHMGKTPPCTEAIAQAGIKRVVVGTRESACGGRRLGCVASTRDQRHTCSWRP
jgi:diaminohydroxyphosphoribosylaminopyrimidine deaminase / 5-amino-6-(5-phosphoribosylamino)uracil reductase